jgi:hypothetical protein
MMSVMSREEPLASLRREIEQLREETDRLVVKSRKTLRESIELSERLKHPENSATIGCVAGVPAHDYRATYD